MEAATTGKLPEDVSRKSYSKGDTRYWLVPGRLFKDHGVADYSCRFSFKGRRAQVCLKTANQREAARKAAELYSKIVNEGWEAGLADYRPDENPENSACATVGGLIEAASRLSPCLREQVGKPRSSCRRRVRGEWKPP